MNILILSPHTDDAELGAGGTIVKLSKDNNLLWVVYSTCEDSLPDGQKDSLKSEFYKVRDHFKCDTTVFNYPVRKLNEHRQKVLESLVQIRDVYKPDLVIGPSINDLHQDHKVVAEEMLRAFKECSLISYQLPWNLLNVKNQMFSELSTGDLNVKLRLLSYYKSQQHRSYFKPEYIKSWAFTNGSIINKKYAEIFEVIRWNL